MKAHWAFFVLLLAFLASRLAAIASAGSFWFDEAFSAHFAGMNWPVMWQYLQYEHNPLLHFAVLHEWMRWFPSSDLSLRVPSLLAGLLSMIGIYALGTKLFSRAAGWWAAFFMTASTMLLYHQTEARMYAFVVLFAVGCIICHSRPICHSREGGNPVLKPFTALVVDPRLRGDDKRGDDKGGRGDDKKPKTAWIPAFAGMTGAIIGYTLSAIALTHTHITGWSLVIALAAYQVAEWMAKKPTHKEVLRWAAAYAFIIAAFLFWFIPVAQNKIAVGDVEQGWFFSQHERGYFFTHLTNALVNGEDRLPLRSAAAALMSFLLLSAMVTFDRPSWWQRVKHLFDHDRWPLSLSVHWTPQIRLLFFCLAIPLLLGFALQVTVSKYLLVATVPLFILIGHGASRFKFKTQAILALALVLLVLPMHLRLYLAPRHHWQQAAQTVAELKRDYPKAPIIVHSFAYALPLERYLDQQNVKIQPFYGLTDELTFDQRVARYNWQGLATTEVADRFVADFSQNNAILVSSSPSARETDPLKAAFFSQGWQINSVYTWDGYGDPEILLLKRQL